MTIAPDERSGAVRQPWRAALCLAAVAAGALAIWHAASGQAVIGRFGVLLALGLAGFGVTRLAMALPDGRSIPRGLGKVWAAIALWSLPALILVVLASLLAGVMLAPPADLVDQSWIALWTLTGTSGAELLKQDAYDPGSGESVLMHGWLPGVAAQLALGWSLILVALRSLGLRRWPVACAAAGALVSLALDLTLRRQGFDLQAFYLAPPQAWPFLIGALAAMTQLKPWRHGGGAAGAVLDIVARVGVLALPFYLWSWPLLAWPKLILARPLTGLETLAALAGALLLATATHRWLETPVRRRFGGRMCATLVAAIIGLSLVAGAAAAIYALDGLPGRAPAQVLAEEAGMRRRPPLSALCHTESEVVPPSADCTVPAGRPADVVLWGNSHADHLSPAVLAWSEARGLGVRQATRSGCLPLVRPRAGLADAGCIRFNRAAVEEWEAVRPRLILVGAAWSLLIAGTPGDDALQLEAMAEEVTHTVRTLRAALGPETEIVLIGTTPDYRFSPARCHARRAFLGLSTARCDEAEPANARIAAAVGARLAVIAATEPGVALYRPWDALCDAGRCRTRGPGGAWYSDPHHLTRAGGAAQSGTLAHLLQTRFADGP